MIVSLSWNKTNKFLYFRKHVWNHKYIRKYIYYALMHFRSRKLEFTQYGENTNEHCSMKINSSLSSLILLLVMMVYILSENFRKLHTSLLENIITAMLTIPHHIVTLIEFLFSSIRKLLPRSDSNEWDLIEEAYQFSR